jgi:hypothetical protein
MTWAILATALILATLYTHLWVEMSHDTQDRDPYHRKP